MKRLVILMMCFSLLCIPVQASETTNEKLVALTFDDGPSGRFTRRLLAGLEERGAKATFFLCGYRIEQYQTLTEQIYQAGHEIGLHGYSHCSLDDKSKCDVNVEIEKTMALIPEGCRVTLFRSPGGRCGEGVLAAAKAQGLSLLYWSLDPKDWATDDTAAIKQRILSQVRDGDVILMHDMSDSSVDAALAIVDVLQSRGYRFVTVSELAEAKGVTLTPGEVYSRFDGENQK